MKKLLFSFCIALCGVLFLSEPVYAECERGTLSVSPTSGTTNTTFGYSGVLQNCSNKGVGTISLLGIVAVREGGGGEPFSYPLQTDASGTFIGTGKFTTPGTYKFFIKNNRADIILSEQPMVTVTEGRPYQCGEEVSAGSKCPDDCSNKYNEANKKWYCGEPQFSAIGCATLTLSQIGPCTAKTLSNVIRCGTNSTGYACNKAGMQICMNGAVSEANVVCQDPNAVPPPTPPCADPASDGSCKSFTTAVGDINTNPIEFIKRLFGMLLGISGGIAVALIIFSGYELMVSQGNKETVQAARDRLTSAIVGLLFIVFSLVILQVIGVDILSIPGFSR